MIQSQTNGRLSSKCFQIATHRSLFSIHLFQNDLQQTKSTKSRGKKSEKMHTQHKKVENNNNVQRTLCTKWHFKYTHNGNGSSSSNSRKTYTNSTKNVVHVFLSFSFTVATTLEYFFCFFSLKCFPCYCHWTYCLQSNCKSLETIHNRFYFRLRLLSMNKLKPIFHPDFDYNLHISTKRFHVVCGCPCFLFSAFFLARCVILSWCKFQCMRFIFPK